MFVHVCPPVHINNVQLPQEEDVKYLGLYLDRRLPGTNTFSQKRKQLGITLTKMYWSPGRKLKLSTNNKLLIYRVRQKDLGQAISFSVQNLLL
jgi:hypothetical protein